MIRQLRPLITEFIGTFAIVFVGSASLMMSGRTQSHASLAAAAFCYAMTVAAMVAAFARISAHFNPAITIGFMVTRQTAPVEGVLKIVAQCVGAIAGGFLLSAVYPPDLLQATRVGGTFLASDVTFGHGVILEAVTTALLALTVCGVSATDAKPAETGVAVGFVVGALIFAIGPLTGASFNPARSLGPAMASGVWEGHLVYWVGPIAGSVAGMLLWRLISSPEKRQAPA
jgi:aquaporin Z